MATITAKPLRTNPTSTTSPHHKKWLPFQTTPRLFCQKTPTLASPSFKKPKTDAKTPKIVPNHSATRPAVKTLSVTRLWKSIIEISLLSARNLWVSLISALARQPPRPSHYSTRKGLTQGQWIAVVCSRVNAIIAQVRSKTPISFWQLQTIRIREAQQRDAVESKILPSPKK